MDDIRIDGSVTRESLVELVTKGGIAQLESFISQGLVTRARLFELGEWIFCQPSNDPDGVMRWSSSASTWTDGTEDLEEARYALTGEGGEDGDDSDELN